MSDVPVISAEIPRFPVQDVFDGAAHFCISGFDRARIQSAFQIAGYDCFLLPFAVILRSSDFVARTSE